MQPSELITRREETRAGFVAMALEKNALAVPYVDEAKALYNLASKVSSARDLVGLPEINAALLAASGLSNKSLVYLAQEDKEAAILGLVEKFLEPAGDGFAEELVYRYLLTKGDALGGQARNLAGILGDRRFFRKLLSVLRLAGVSYIYLDSETGVWLEQTDLDAGIENRIKAISWKRGEDERIFIKNSKVPLIGKNVDLVLLAGGSLDYTRTCRGLLLINAKYLALGELKGGIDPAGSDEHWKTANFALNRIRKEFGGQGLNPPTFFVGAAIEATMADEICQQMRAKVLTHAANLTNDSQLVGVCEWIINL